MPSPRPGARAILIGTASYTHPDLTAIPAALNNLTDLRQILTSAGGAFAPEHCVVVPDPRSGTEVGEALAEAAGEATDVLLVYYTGHGVLDSRGRLHLTVTGTNPARPSWSSVPFQMLREEILESRATARVLILDCCYSGRAFEAMSDTTTVIAGETSIHGTYTITSSAANEASFAPRGDRNTAFTAALLAAAKAADLTLDDLYRRTEQHLIDHGHPRPRRRSIDAAGGLKLLGATDELRFRRAADAGDVATMNSLGVLLHKRGDLDEAETWYRKAADTGHTSAIYNLGLLFEDRGGFDEAEIWYRKAAGTGHTRAMNSLGVRLDKRGELDEAETWYRKAADTGHTSAIYNLGLLLENRGEFDQAETWYRKAADTGHTRAMNNLGVRLDKRGEPDEAETWYRKAADTGHTSAIYNLGLLLEKNGQLDEAETWYRKAADTGHTKALNNLRLLVEKRGSS
ncbi:caspase, EACC1-associated type [Nocardia sp. FBN12]|uniref:caspase, EACC1-associated type n=1 Tax=Nocardia sp. FBN12 TaxID=3419766 RepID=UPI003D03D1EF